MIDMENPSIKVDVDTDGIEEATEKVQSLSDAIAAFPAQVIIRGARAKIGSSGDGAKIVSEGEKSVICCAGHGCTVSAKAGSWITLAEWTRNEETCKWEPLTVRTFYVDGETIKADTPYKLEGGELKEVKG